MKLNKLSPTKGSTRTRKRLGCGVASGQGKTGGRGHKGQKSRTGGKVARGFEGGQMPLIRRVPKRGFTARSKTIYQLVNVEQLKAFDEGSKVDAEALKKAGLIRAIHQPVKILGQGDIDRKLDVVVTALSATAKAKIEAAKGSVTVS